MSSWDGGGRRTFGGRRALLPDVRMGQHTPSTPDRRFVDDPVRRGELLTATGASPVVIAGVIATTPTGSRAKSFASRASYGSFSESGALGAHDPSFPGPGADGSLGASGLWSAAANLGNGIIGAGIIGLPYAIGQAGFLLGLALICTMAIVTHYTVTLMIETGRAHAKFSYEALCEHAFGAPGFFALTCLQALSAFGACVAYMLIIADTSVVVLSNCCGSLWWGFSDRTIVVACVSSLVLLPLSLYRNMAHLEKWSFLSLCSIVAIAVLLIYVLLSGFGGSALGKALHYNHSLLGHPNRLHGGSDYNDNNSTTAPGDLQHLLFDVHPRWPSAMGTVAFAFCCQQYSFFVFGTLHNPTRSRWCRVSAISTLAALVLSLLLGVAGYLEFGPAVTLPNVLDNFPPDDTLANVIRIVLTATMLLTFPLDFFVVRYTLQRLVQRLCGCGCGGGGGGDNSGGNSAHSKGLLFTPVITREHMEGRGHAGDMSLTAHFLCTLMLWGVCLGTCIAALSLGGQGQGLALVLQFTGSIGAIFTSFVFPTATFLMLGDGTGSRRQRDAERWCPCMPASYFFGRRCFALLVLLVGAAAGIIGTWSTVVDAMAGGSRNGTAPL
jgi:amino acid permease